MTPSTALLLALVAVPSMVRAAPPPLPVYDFKLEATVGYFFD